MSEAKPIGHTIIGSDRCTSSLGPEWEWDVFGTGLMVVTGRFVVPLWRRTLTRIFLGSKWTRLPKSTYKLPDDWLKLQRWEG